MTQCMGTTQKGDRCKRNASDGSDFCNAHGFQAGADAEWKNPKPKAEPKAKSRAEDEPQEAWSWSECCTFDSDTLKWAAIGAVAFGAVMLLRRR